VDPNVEVAFNEKVVDSLDILVFACVGCANNGADTDGVLVNQIDTFLRINDPSLFSAVDVLQQELATFSSPQNFAQKYAKDIPFPQHQSISPPSPSKLAQPSS
jgi:hypothetical protein